MVAHLLTDRATVTAAMPGLAIEQKKAPRAAEDLAVFAAPGIFVVLWASGFIGAKLGLPYAEPLTFLWLRMMGAVLLLGIIILLTRPPMPSRAETLHSAATGLLVHGLYLGVVYVSIWNGLPAALSALVVGLQPLLTSTIANRWLGERVMPRQWLRAARRRPRVFLGGGGRAAA